MSLINSNTYVEPVSGTSLNNARLQFNNSLRSVLTNFRSPVAPSTLNVRASGDNIGEQDGMLYRSTVTNAIYISDSNQVKSAPVGGNFTRVGIGNRVENGIEALAANAESYEIGELVTTVSEDGVLGANARLYLCTSNATTNGSASGFLDVGAPLGYTVGTNDNVEFSGQSVSAIRFLATSNVGINTNSPTTSLDVRGDITVADKIIHAGDTNTFISFPGADTVSIETAGSERIRVTSSGDVGIGTLTPASKLGVNGTVTATDFNSTSDARLKENVEPLATSLDKILSLAGVRYNLIGNDKIEIGLLAQDVEIVIPEVVSTAENDLKSVSYSRLVPVLIEAVKDQNTIINDLITRVKKLENTLQS